MSSPKRKRTSKTTPPKTARNLITEINKCERKLRKLLERNKLERKTKNKKTTSLFQGIKKGSERHQKLQSYIDKLKTQLSQTKSVQLPPAPTTSKSKNKRK
jgi:hypothetical protein